MDFIFRELASDDLIIYFLDEEKTEVDDIYQETTKKIYDKKIRVTGKVRVNVTAGSKEDIWKDNVTIIVPIVEFKQAEEVKKTIQGHIDRQDLSWSPLSKNTIRLKHGNSTIYVESGTLRNSITATRISSGSTYSVWSKNKRRERT